VSPSQMIAPASGMRLVRFAIDERSFSRFDERIQMQTIRTNLYPSAAVRAALPPNWTAHMSPGSGSVLTLAASRRVLLFRLAATAQHPHLTSAGHGHLGHAHGEASASNTTAPLRAAVAGRAQRPSCESDGLSVLNP